MQAQAGPKDDQHDIGAAWLWNIVRILEVMGGQQRLPLPQHRFQPEMVGEFLIQPADHRFGDQPLWPHIGGRGDEDPQRFHTRSLPTGASRVRLPISGDKAGKL